MENGADGSQGWALALALLDAWLHWALLAVVLLGIAGLLGKGAGLSNIFRDDAVLMSARARHGYVRVLWSSPAFWTHASVALVTGLVWIYALERPGLLGDGCSRYAIWPPEECGAGPGPWLMVAAAAVVALIALAASLRDACALRVDESRPPRAEIVAEMIRAGLGLAAGLAVLWLLWLGAREWGDLAFRAIRAIAAEWPANIIGIFNEGAESAWRDGVGGWVEANWTPPIAFVSAMAILLLVIPLASPKVLACLSLTGLIAGLVMFTGLFDRIEDGLAEIAALALIAWVWVANSPRFKLRIPGFPAELYDDPIDPNGDGALPGNPNSIKPVEALSAWAAGAGAARDGKPRLVLLATSGGAYRASFWTALMLDRLAEESGEGARLGGLMESIRLVTGASGGMVAGAYFTAMAAEGATHGGVRRRIEADIEAFQKSAEGGARSIPIPRDSLTPVAQRMVRRDLPLILTRRVAKDDRGQVLDRQWETLKVTFADIEAKEREGKAPSIIFSPMLIESGAPAFITNLDLDELRRRAVRRDSDNVNAESVELFDAFPGARGTADAKTDEKRGLTFATAVRLNATFPFVSPAISLPTWPQRRVVDAGYYDNYGVDLATAYLLTPSIRDWVLENCSGVAVLQLRAFPSDGTDKPKKALSRAFQWLTSPAEGVFSARGSSQMFRNNQQMRLVESIYEDLAGQGFLRGFVFEADADASMSWYLPEDELRAMERLLHPKPDPEGSSETARGKTKARRSEIERELDRLARFWAGAPTPRA